MATLSDFFKPVTQAAYFALMMADHLVNGVPTASWTSPRNTGLSLTQILALHLAALRTLLITAVMGLFLDYATGVPLTLFAKSMYQIDRTPAQFTSGILTLTAVPTAPPQAFQSGDVTIGTPGPQTQNTRLFVSTEAGQLQVGRLQVAGGGQGITFIRKGTGVTLQVIVAGLSTALTVPVVIGKAVVINQSTDAAGNPTGTATAIAAAIAAQATAAAQLDTALGGAGSFILGAIPTTSLDVGTLLLAFSATQPGAAWNIPTGSPLVMKTSPAGVSVANTAWLNGTWITSQGADEESDQRLLQRCPARWGTLGVAGNEDGAIFWAMAIPNGYTASPVAQAVIFSGYLNGTYAEGATVVIIGPNGALGAGDVAAVQANFDSPINSLAGGPVPGLDQLARKYVIGELVSVISAANHVITLTGTVYLYRRANVSIPDAQAAVTDAIAAYQATLRMGQTIFPQKKVAGVIGQAAPIATAVKEVDLSGMADSITSTRTQYPLLDTSGITYQLVDA